MAATCSSSPTVGSTWPTPGGSPTVPPPTPCSLWRGDALDEFVDCPGLAVEKVALDELRLRLGDDALEAAIAAGASRSADAASAAAASPMRERTVILLMRSYAVEGRTAEAMHTAAAYRRRLAEETGLDPSPALGTWERLVAAGSLAPSRVRTTSTVRTPAGPLVGRDQDLAELLRLLDTQPVLTVTGPGGVGKTRLTLQAAAEHSERTGAESVAVRLATVTDGDRVPEAVAAALGLRLVGDAAPETVARMLTGRAALLVLDNCEHVVDAVRDLAVALHEVAPTVRLLTTSRVTLHVPGEFVVRLQPLPLPRDGDLARLGHQPSVQAFVEHARLRGRDFTPTPGDSAVLVDVVRRLDGLPLAIELAAGQLGAVPLSALHERLGRALDALSARRPTSDARHETLRATIDWSYRLSGTRRTAPCCAAWRRSPRASTWRHSSGCPPEAAPASRPAHRAGPARRPLAGRRSPGGAAPLSAAGDHPDVPAGRSRRARRTHGGRDQVPALGGVADRRRDQHGRPWRGGGCGGPPPPRRARQPARGPRPVAWAR